MEYNVLDSIWFTPEDQFMGIVVIDANGHGLKAYLGSIPAGMRHMDKEDHEQYIAAHGARLGSIMAKAAFPHAEENTKLLWLS